MIAELQSALQGQEVGLPLLRTTLLKPHKEVLLDPEWVGSQSWVHSELAGSSEVQWPALPAKLCPLRDKQRIYSSVEGPDLAHLLPLETPEEGTLTTEFLSGSQSGFVGGSASGI